VHELVRIKPDESKGTVKQWNILTQLQHLLMGHRTFHTVRLSVNILCYY